MYLVDLKDKDKSTPRLCLYGNIREPAEIRQEISQILQSTGEIEEIIVDLSGVESICEECFNVLIELTLIHKTKFVGYSLFIEHQLIKYNLIS